eukprot:7621522-Heterocapsa_arctica.AAC.1
MFEGHTTAYEPTCEITIMFTVSREGEVTACVPNSCCRCSLKQAERLRAQSPVFDSAAEPARQSQIG